MARHLPALPPLFLPGDHVEKGQVICIVEAMKLMNEIESDASGEIVKCLVTNGQPIEFGQPLFSIRVGITAQAPIVDYASPAISASLKGLNVS